jgi:hypothetical protein
MATVYWEPKVEAVAQVATGTIDSVDATPSNNTFIVTIGGYAISAVGDTDVATTATNLRASLNASTNPYFAAITWSGTGGTITGTADTAGCPFTAALTETGAGTGAVTDFSDTTASASAHDAGDANNWDGGALPIASDEVVIRDSSVSLLYGLTALSAVSTLASVRSDHTFTGKIGLQRKGFATSEDGETIDATVPEYRAHYWDIQADEVIIGRSTGLEQSGGSARIKIDNGKAGASLLRVEQTVSSVSGDKPAVLYLAANASADVEVLSATAGVGIAADAPGETSTVGDITVVDSTSGSRVITGEGVTLTSWEQQGGQNVLNAAATVTSVVVHGGQLDIVGDDYTITTLTVNDGEVNDSHRATGAEWTTVNLLGGTLDLTGTQEARTITTLNPDGGTLSAPFDELTITTLDKPAGLVSMALSAVS